MEYTTLGKTGLKVSRMGLGGIPVQRVGPAEAKALIDAVEAAGVNYIDTARGYTVSEELLGQALEGRREKFILATKAMAWDRDSMVQAVETSLKNLRTDHIDLYQIHNPSLQQLEQVCAPGGALEALMEAKAAGKVRHLGITAHLQEVFRKALELDWVETVMFPYNIVESQGTELMERAREKNIGFINMKSLAGGAIEDARLALRFAASNPNVTVVLPGMYTPEEVAENAAAVADAWGTASSAGAATVPPARRGSAYHPPFYFTATSAAMGWRTGPKAAIRPCLPRPGTVWNAEPARSGAPTVCRSGRC